MLVLPCLLLPGTALHSAVTPLTFEQHVRPILKAYCIDCHGGQEDAEAELDLRLRRFIVKGGDSGPAVEPGHAGRSLLLKQIKSGKMPPGEKKVDDDDVAMIERWINEGARARVDEPQTLPRGMHISEEDRAQWAYQPRSRPQPPAVEPGERAVTPVDAFVLAKLRGQGRTFAPEADRRTLIIRASMDLTGLAPTVAEIDQFIADKAEGAYERLLDRLLASPHYGERWARHWLDVAGYADSEGNGNEDSPRPHAYKYRDYVIRSFNADKPLNDFIIEQLAGDELVPRPWTQLAPDQLDKLIATGFLRNAPDPTAGRGGDVTTAANQVMADTIKIIGSALYGMTIACAQCHDHRYDPISQEDYFRLRAVFEPALNPQQWRRPGQRMISLYTEADRAKVAQVNAEAQKMREARAAKERGFIVDTFEKNLVKFPEEMRQPLREAFMLPENRRSAAQKKLLTDNPSANVTPGVLYQYDQAKADELKKDQEAIAAKEAQRPVEDFVRVLSEVPGQIPVTHLHHRGDHRQPRQEVKPGDLTIAAREGERFEIATKDPLLVTTGRRLALAKHLTGGRQPMLPRVLANRIWLHHFGRGLVDTPGDFGALGVKPTHPQLLDWLADELIARGWSMKQMHKLIMTSAVYRQSSRAVTAASAADEDHDYGRFPLRRLDAEIIRDRMLDVSGALDRKLLGPAVAVAEDSVGMAVAEGDSPRRSIYLQVMRSKPESFLATFDVATPSPNCERRVSSTTSPQALMLMNSEFVLKRAGEMAARVRRETPAGFMGDRVKAQPSPQRRVDVWSYGMGGFDTASQRVSSFAALPHFTGGAWQGSSVLPDPKLGWVILHAGGGHTGETPGHAVIRRWTAPLPGKLIITGKLSHPSENGDGVRGRIVSSRSGLAGEWIARKAELATNVAAIDVQPGDTIDFITDCIDNVNSDSFGWPVNLKLTLAPQSPPTPVGGAALTWNSTADFRGPRSPLPPQIAYAWQLAYLRPISAGELQRAMQFITQQLSLLESTDAKGDHELIAMTNLCQQLLSSNEFLYVD